MKFRYTGREEVAMDGNIETRVAEKGQGVYYHVYKGPRAYHATDYSTTLPGTDYGSGTEDRTLSFIDTCWSSSSSLHLTSI